MKKIAILFCSFLLMSCNLDEKPYGFYSQDNFYNTVEEAQSALYYAYASMNHNEYARSLYYINELATETCDVKSEEGFGAQEINRWDYGQLQFNEQLELFFKYSYISINRVNAVLDNVVNSSIDANEKKRILGEAHFLRAWNYYNLTKTFGLVPVHKQVITSASQTFPFLAKNMDEIYNFIIEDLTFAANNLEIRRSVGCADKVAAESLLAKVYLTIASSKESQVNLYTQMTMSVNEAYGLASTWSGKVLYEQSEYSLDPSLVHIYDTTAPTGPEHIFLMSMDASGITEGNFSSIDKMFIPYKDGNSLWFANTDGTYTKATNLGWGVFMPTDFFVNTFENADLRKTVLLPKRFFKNATGTSYEDNSYNITRKFIDPNFAGGKSSVKPFLIRFSDIALVYAEAQGPTANGYLWLNKIRHRAGLADAPTMAAAAYRNYVVVERSHELCFEGQRLHDLRRKGIVTSTDPRAQAAGITEAQAAFYPIPQKEIDLNPNL